MLIAVDYALISIYALKIWCHLRSTFALTTEASSECQLRFRALNIQVTTAQILQVRGGSSTIR